MGGDSGNTGDSELGGTSRGTGEFVLGETSRGSEKQGNILIQFLKISSRKQLTFGGGNVGGVFLNSFILHEGTHNYGQLLTTTETNQLWENENKGNRN